MMSGQKPVGKIVAPAVQHHEPRGSRTTTPPAVPGYPLPPPAYWQTQWTQNLPPKGMWVRPTPGTKPRFGLLWTAPAKARQPSSPATLPPGSLSSDGFSTWTALDSKTLFWPEKRGALHGEIATAVCSAKRIYHNAIAPLRVLWADVKRGGMALL